MKKGRSAFPDVEPDKLILVLDVVDDFESASRHHHKSQRPGYCPNSFDANSGYL